MLDLFLPQRCVVCSAPGAQACSRCVALFPRVVPPLCARCGAPVAWRVDRCRDCAGRRVAFASAHAAVIYDERVRAFVAAWKERALRRFAAMAAEIVVEVVPPPEGVVTYVPADPNRGLRRGHDPPRSLAEQLAGHWGLPCVATLRRRLGPRQRGLSRVDRRQNVRGLFEAPDSPPEIVLVDDVFTSGATANAAASALRKGGARRVDVVTFARVVR